LINSLANLLPSLDKETLLFTVQNFPDYVQSRYDTREFSRIDLGTLLMSTQFVSGEVLRQFSTRNCRSYFTSVPDNEFDLTSRTFPKK
jgi:hypothetical protein